MRKADDASIRAGPICHTAGCVAKLYNGRRVTLTYNAEDLADDCAFAAIVVTPLDAPEGCKAFAVDRITTERNGAVALTLAKDKITLTGARDPLADRPWIMKRGTNTETETDVIAP